MKRAASQNDAAKAPRERERERNFLLAGRRRVVVVLSQRAASPFNYLLCHYIKLALLLGGRRTVPICDRFVRAKSLLLLLPLAQTREIFS